MAFVGVTDSYEAYYQAVRRCWRFGQSREVHVHIFASKAEGAIVSNLKRKEREAKMEELLGLYKAS
jgi:SNF2 family DNA or RNA helicase